MTRKDRKSIRERMKGKMKTHSTNLGKKGSAVLRVPDGVELFIPEEENEYEINIHVYEVTRQDHPDIVRSHIDIEPGDVWYRHHYGIHYNVGGSNRAILCPNITFGKPCPICEERQRLMNESYDDNIQEIRTLKPSTNCLFNVTIGSSDKVMLFDWAIGKFANLLEVELQKSKKKDAFMFADPDEGYTIETRVIEDTYQGKKFFKADKLNFVKRGSVSDDILDKCICLDDIFKETSYADIKKMFLGMDEDDKREDNEEPDTRNRKFGRKPKDDDDDVDVVDDSSEETVDVQVAEQEEQPKKAVEETTEETSDEDWVW